MPNVLTRVKAIGLYLPKKRSNYLPLTTDSFKVLAFISPTAKAISPFNYINYKENINIYNIKGIT